MLLHHLNLYEGNVTIREHVTSCETFIFLSLEECLCIMHARNIRIRIKTRYFTHEILRCIFHLNKSFYHKINFNRFLFINFLLTEIVLLQVKFFERRIILYITVVRRRKNILNNIVFLEEKYLKKD